MSFICPWLSVVLLVFLTKSFQDQNSQLWNINTKYLKNHFHNIIVKATHPLSINLSKVISVFMMGQGI
jgi:hypothetical protein